jgi:hypothetical protein
MELSGIDEAIRLAQERWPKTEWRVKTADEACSPCPWCGGEDRFVLWQHGYYMCRPAPDHCGREGWLDEDKQQHWTPQERRLRRIEAEQARARRERDHLQRQIEALKRMAECSDHVRYHRALDEEGFEWCAAQGLQMHVVMDYQIGLCERCPTDREGRPSYTFPIWRKDGPLWSIRHRLIGVLNGDKYRPHVAGLGLQLVNARMLPDWSERVIVVEGCKKARVIQGHDLPVVGILGKAGFEDRWLNWFHPAATIYLALDPDAQDSADKLAHRIAGHGKHVHIAQFPAKPDDLFADGCTVDEWESYLRLARKVA